jgi:hypothetical protein
MSSLATWGVTSSNSDVKDDNDRLLATYPFNTNPIQSNPIEKDLLPIRNPTAAHLIQLESLTYVMMISKKKKKKKRHLIASSILMILSHSPLYLHHLHHHHHRLNALKKELILKELHRNSTVEAVQLLARFFYHPKLLNFHKKMKQTAPDQ